MRILIIVHLQLAVALEDGFHEELEDRHLLLCRHVSDFKFYSDEVIECYKQGEV